MEMDQAAALDLQNSRILPSKEEIGAPKKPSSKKKLFLTFSYLSAIPLFIVFVMLFSLSVKYESNGYISRQEHKPQFQALPDESNVSSIAVENNDARAQALEEFFSHYKSPLSGLGQHIVNEADKNKIDYRLLPAIAMQESTLCKRIIPSSHNCWGWGIYGTKVTKFESFEKAISTISQRLSVKYVQKGYTTPEQIVQKYTPSDDGKWSGTVSMMMDKIHKSL